MNSIDWLSTPEEHDYPAAESFLNLLMSTDEVKIIVNELKAAPITYFKAKDILRASTLVILSEENHHVSHNLKKIKNKDALSPVLLVRGKLQAGVPLTIADGYHRICAAYLYDEDCEIPCKITDVSI